MSYLGLLQPRSRAMAIVVVVFVFRAVWVVGWYLEWAMSGQPIGSSFCVIWELCGSLIFQDVNVTSQFVF